MMYADIEEARALRAALKSLVERHGCASPDYRALRRVLDLCRRAADAVEDRYCREKLRIVEDSAAEMFCAGESRALYLKQQCLTALELFDSRLYSVETLRRSPRRPGLLVHAR